MARAIVLVSLSLTFAGCSKDGPNVPTSSAPSDVPSSSASERPTVSPSAGPDAGDPVDALVTRLTASPLWINGTFPAVKLPQAASPSAVLGEMFTKISFEPGPVKTHTIVSTREVRIGAEPKPYTAVVVDTNLGRKIVLLQHQGDSGWWSRVFPYAP